MSICHTSALHYCVLVALEASSTSCFSLDVPPNRFFPVFHKFVGVYSTHGFHSNENPDYLQITYYVLRKDTPEDWKCQPYHWLPKELEIHEIVVGAFSLAIGSLISSAMACWIMNGGWTKLYFDHTEHGYLWLLIQTPLVFIWQVNF